MRHTLFIFVLLAVVASAQTRPTKKLIEFGWDMPDTAFMRQHFADMDKLPFDGCVFRVMYLRPDGKLASFMNEAWGRVKLTDAQIARAIDDLQHAPFKKVTDNFVRLNVTPGDVDWFDDFSAIASNARLAAKIAREGKCAGILFDTEMYAAHLWDYRKQRDRATKSFDAYAQQVHAHGREFMQAIQDEYPGIKIFLTFGYSLPLVQGAKTREKLATIDYGLLVPFLDGMFEVADGATRIIDGFEISYGWKQDSEFDDGISMMRKGVLPIVADPEKYDRVVSCGFGLWLDRDWQKLGWDTTDVSKNYFTPESFEHSLRSALKHSDEYVWIYSQKPKWWTPRDGKTQNVPDEYLKAMEKARK
jgi:hypothetical protein